MMTPGTPRGTEGGQGWSSFCKSVKKIIEELNVTFSEALPSKLERCESSLLAHTLGRPTCIYIPLVQQTRAQLFS